jgi:hypothetical protein
MNACTSDADCRGHQPGRRGARVADLRHRRYPDAGHVRSVRRAVAFTAHRRRYASACSVKPKRPNERRPAPWGVGLFFWSFRFAAGVAQLRTS